MNLLEHLKHQVPEEVRLQGQQLIDQRSVRITASRKGFLTAQMGERHHHAASVELDGGQLYGTCDCSAHRRGEICAHVWAAVLEAQMRGCLDEVEESGEFVDILNERNAEIAEDLMDNWDEQMPHASGQGDQKKQAARNWKYWLDRVNVLSRNAPPVGAAAWPAGRNIFYTLDVAKTLEGEGMVMEIGISDLRRDGTPGRIVPTSLPYEFLAAAPHAADREILSLLGGVNQMSQMINALPETVVIDPLIQDRLIEAICKTGRCLLRKSPHSRETSVLNWDDEGPWECVIEVRREEPAGMYVMNGWLVRGEQRRSLLEPVLVIAGGLVIWNDKVGRLDDRGAFEWLALLRGVGRVVVPLGHGQALVNRIVKMSRWPKLELPEELRFTEEVHSPERRILLKRGRRPDRLAAEVAFAYGENLFAPAARELGQYDAANRKYVRRDVAAERAAMLQLGTLGFRDGPQQDGRRTGVELSAKLLPHATRALAADGWRVEAEGRLYRTPGKIALEISSGVDWFDLKGKVSYGEVSVELPELLAAARRGEGTVLLSDGSVGVLPEEWLEKYAMLAGTGKKVDGGLRFTRSQGGLLDVMLASEPEAIFDAGFTRLREELAQFSGVAPLPPPPGFIGVLRPYQCDGLGWFAFLRKFGFGGCLADDMGLGKTVQVLALLEKRREEGAAGGEGANAPPAINRTSLVVAPRSLVFNWISEARRFAPNLKLLDHTGPDRLRSSEHFAQYDVVLATYGTLRVDAAIYKDFVFDYAILDEAQAVKNSGTEAAKAVRLLKAANRLALSGTPVQNHLGELWSLFEFLNPGMLGSASVFDAAWDGPALESTDGRGLLARALRPFILRRTKQQVARELPDCTEQTIFCELDAAQRKNYDQLREHYRAQVLNAVADQGIGKSKFLVLEALLRLRQAACHPGLIDKSRVGEGSAKLETLLERLEEVIEEGHKALVFSQFTSLLAIVRNRLDAKAVTYEYLDGKTRDRGQRVQRFQTDESCRLFLISLKAGGLGLNLTAADYVFLLDPWWNPAVEAQAIDRAHRIGQNQRVFAYRLIARETVEEKVLELQRTKRELAEAIIGQNNSVLAALTKDDLQLLLS